MAGGVLFTEPMSRAPPRRTFGTAPITDLSKSERFNEPLPNSSITNSLGLSTMIHSFKTIEIETRSNQNFKAKFD